MTDTERLAEFFVRQLGEELSRLDAGDITAVDATMTAVLLVQSAMNRALGDLKRLPKNDGVGHEVSV